MGQIAKLCAVKRNVKDRKTLEGQLNQQNMNRIPGTADILVPLREVNGKYRTGLDPEALYLNKLSPEEKKMEVDRINGWRDWLQDHVDLKEFTPASEYYTRMFADVDLIDTDQRARMVKVENRDVLFNMDKPFDLITYCWVRTLPNVAASLMAIKEGRAKKADYYLYEEEQEEKQTFEQKRETNETIALFTSMSVERQRKVARMMGLPVQEDTPDRTVYNLLDTTIKQKELTGGTYKGQNPLKVFASFASMNEGNLEIQDLVKQLQEFSILRKIKGVLYDGENEMGSESDLITFLLQKKNAMQVEAFKERLKTIKQAG